MPLLLKFIGPFGILLALIARMIRPQTLCCIGGGPLLGWECLAAHHSQFVWYRKLFMTCSQYLYVNTLIPANSLKHSVTQ